MPLASRLTKSLATFALVFFPLALIGMIEFNRRQYDWYWFVMKEDGVIEWLTALFLFIAGAVMWAAWWRLWRRESRFHWFVLAFALACTFMAGEEISWGQRVFNVESPEFFAEENLQGETNVHNLIFGGGRLLVITTGDALSILMLGYGVLLPLLSFSAKVRAWLARLRIIAPPLDFAPGFIIAASLTHFDLPTGGEEEWGECFFGMLLMFTALVSTYHRSPSAAYPPQESILADTFRRAHQWLTPTARRALVILSLTAVVLTILSLIGFSALNSLFIAGEYAAIALLSVQLARRPQQRLIWIFAALLFAALAVLTLMPALSIPAGVVIVGLVLVVLAGEALWRSTPLSERTLFVFLIGLFTVIIQPQLSEIPITSLSALVSMIGASLILAGLLAYSQHPQTAPADFDSILVRAARWLTPTARHVLVVLLVVQIILVVLSRVGIPLLRLDVPFGAMALFISVQYLAAALLCVQIALRVQLRLQRLLWFFVAFVFAALSFYSAYIPHVTVEPAAVVIIGTITAVVLLALWRLTAAPERLLFLFLGGMILIAQKPHLQANNSPDVAGFLIMSGGTLVIAGLLAYSQHLVGVKTSRSITRFVPALAAFGWAVWLIAALWAAPLLQSRSASTPVRVQYLDDALTLVGYRYAPDRLNPDSDLNITLYWQMDAPPEGEYGISAHLLSQPDLQSATHVDLPLIAYFSPNDWRPIIEQQVRIPVPAELETPASYAVQLSLWESIAGQSYEALPVDAADSGRLLTDDALVLLTIPALPASSQMPPAPFTANADFADGFALMGYALPVQAQAAEPLTLSFWWQTNSNADIQRSLIQFVHFYPVTDDGTLTLAFGDDRAPFDGRFPTVDWPAGSAFVDERTITLPDDLPAGDYQVVTGMYDADTQERAAVFSDGAPVENNIINLGRITIEG